jgi:hypothetical protein
MIFSTGTFNRLIRLNKNLEGVISLCTILTKLLTEEIQMQ